MHSRQRIEYLSFKTPRAILKSLVVILVGSAQPLFGADLASRVDHHFDRASDAQSISESDRQVDPQVDLKDELWHHMGNHSRAGYEWLYFDVLNGDGNQASITFSGPNPFDPALQRHLGLDPENHVGVSVELAMADGRQVSIDQFMHGAKNLTFTSDPYQLVIGKNTVEMKNGPEGLPVYRLRLDAHDSRRGLEVTGELVFTSVEKSWAPNGGYLYQGEGRNAGVQHHWVVAAPRAQVSGWYCLREKDGRKTTVEVSGLGYHDHNFGTGSMSSIVSKWFWGRAFSADKTLIYARILPKSGNKFGYAGAGIVYLSDAGKVLVDTAEGEFDFGDRANLERTREGILSPRAFSARAAGLGHGGSYHFLFRNGAGRFDSLAYYLRRAGEVEIRCPSGA